MRVGASLMFLGLLWASPALAHEGGRAAGFLSGLSHPISGLDHVLAMVAVVQIDLARRRASSGARVDVGE